MNSSILYGVGVGVTMTNKQRLLNCTPPTFESTSTRVVSTNVYHKFHVISQIMNREYLRLVSKFDKYF